MRPGHLFLAPLLFFLSGCFTPSMWRNYSQASAPRELRQVPVPAPSPERLESAVLTSGGELYLETLFADGSLRRHRFVPPTFPPHTPPLLAPELGPLPPGRALVVEREGTPRWPEHWRWRSEKNEEPNRMALRLNQGQLEFSEGEQEFYVLASYPSRQLVKRRVGPRLETGGPERVLRGVAYAAATPLTVALDVAAGVTVVAFSPVLVPILAAQGD